MFIPSFSANYKEKSTKFNYNHVFDYFLFQHPHVLLYESWSFAVKGAHRIVMIFQKLTFCHHAMPCTIHGRFPYSEAYFIWHWYSHVSVFWLACKQYVFCFVLAFTYLVQYISFNVCSFFPIFWRINVKTCTYSRYTCDDLLHICFVKRLPLKSNNISIITYSFHVLRVGLHVWMQKFKMYSP